MADSKEDITEVARQFPLPAPWQWYAAGETGRCHPGIGHTLRGGSAPFWHSWVVGGNEPILGDARGTGSPDTWLEAQPTFIDACAVLYAHFMLDHPEVDKDAL